jgi:hypothetical protein
MDERMRFEEVSPPCERGGTRNGLFPNPKINGIVPRIRNVGLGIVC